MRSFRRLALAAGVTASLVLTGCGVGDSAGSTDSSDKDAASGKITGEISFQTWNLKASFKDYFNGLIADFEKKNPGTEVKWIDQPADGYADKLSADAAGGTLPDVVNLDRDTGAALADAGELLNLDQADPEAAKTYLKGAWDGNEWKEADGHFAYPWYLNTGPSLFNTALFEKAGLDPKALPKTQDELLDQAMQMAEKSGGKYAMLGLLPDLEMMSKYGIPVMNDSQTEFTFNNPQAVKFVERYVALYKAGAIVPEALSDDYTGEMKNFQSGRLAYMNGSSYGIQNVKQNAPTVYKTLTYTPQIANTAPTMFSQSVAVSKSAKNKATAIAFARFVTDADHQLSFAKAASVLPSTAGTLDDPYFHTSDGSDAGKVRVLTAEQVARAVVYNWPGATESLKTEVREEMAQAVLGKKPVQKALDAAVDFANKSLQDRK
ncbi:sugar ABC transporter substrate-binding protein [Streptomyces sp. NPDC051840]|uniref:ABC transporter substrate-binding protein n=1 Tax=unclassified Streptomyces TaxID=2593676 RepID=UPI00343C5155